VSNTSYAIVVGMTKFDKPGTKEGVFQIRDPETSPFAPQMFGNAGRDHMQKYGSKPERYAWIGYKNHKQPVRRAHLHAAPPSCASIAARARADR
jgi:acetyl-CoA acetyltransferase